MPKNNHSISIAFVCTGNTCRSPMAEMLLKHAIKNEDPPLSESSVVSAGVFAVNGNSANVNVLKSLDINLSDHKSQRLTQGMVDTLDFIFCMTKAHKQIIENDFNICNTTVQLMSKYLEHPYNIDIPDPYGQDLSTYKVCRDTMIEAIPSILNLLRKKLHLPKKNYEN